SRDAEQHARHHYACDGDDVGAEEHQLDDEQQDRAKDDLPPDTHGHEMGDGEERKDEITHAREVEWGEHVSQQEDAGGIAQAPGIGTTAEVQAQVQPQEYGHRQQSRQDHSNELLQLENGAQA